MHERELINAGRTALGWYPVVTLLGPRQVGKTTVARTLMADRPYANLEDPEARRFAQEDPKGFLAGFPEGGVLDEIQRVPELLSWIQVDVDRHAAAGRWILTGSHQPALHAAVGQSLAGRTALLRLHPFTVAELAAAGIRLPLDAQLLAGGFPRLHVAGIPPARFHADYVATYLERDVRQITQLRDLATFQRFIGMLAGRIAQPVNWSSLGADAGVSEVTAKAWGGVLESSFLAWQLKPWHANIGKRLRRHGKPYWCDAGLTAHLIGIGDASQLPNHPLRGALFENLVVAEAVACIAHWDATVHLHVFATATSEVDLIIEAGGRSLAVEIKSGRTIASDWFSGLAAAASVTALAVDRRLVVYGGDDEQVRSDAVCCPWWLFAAHLADWLRARGAARHAPDPQRLRQLLIR